MISQSVSNRSEQFTGIWDCETLDRCIVDKKKINLFLSFSLFSLRFSPIFDSENWLELNVYFQQMSYELIKQQPAYDEESLLGTC